MLNNLARGCPVPAQITLWRLDEAAVKAWRKRVRGGSLSIALARQ